MLSLPYALEPYRKPIEASVQPFIRIQAEPEFGLSITDSKFGGEPYLPTGTDYPSDADGQPLFLLAQINCADLPSMEGTPLGGTPLSDFPRQGMLQFYIADDDLYGMDTDNPTEPGYFQVRYFPQVDPNNCIKDFSFLPEFEDMPLEETYALTFKKAEAPVSLQDWHFDQMLDESPYTFFDQFGGESDLMKRTYNRLAQGGGHKMGGYAHFTQEDPRFREKEYKDAILLLQIDSDDIGICWGDMGIANFFILPEDLKKRDFSRVLYNWDSP